MPFELDPAGATVRLTTKETTVQGAIRRPIAVLVAASLLALSLPAPAHAGEAAPDAARLRVELLLVQNGVDAHEARARVAALTDREAIHVATEFDKLPAGGTDPVTAAAMAVIAVIGLAVLVIVLPFVLLKKLSESNRRDTGDAGPEAQYPEPQY